MVSSLGFLFTSKIPDMDLKKPQPKIPMGIDKKDLRKILFSLDKVPGKGQHAKTDNFYVRMALIQLSTTEKSVALQKSHQEKSREAQTAAPSSSNDSSLPVLTRLVSE